jgi:hypothetical protein
MTGSFINLAGQSYSYPHGLVDGIAVSPAAQQ